MATTNPWDERYASDAFFYGIEPNDFLATSAHHLVSGGKVLCLAEGEGRNAVWLARQGYDVTGVDGSSVGLEKAQALAREHGVSITTITADLAEFDMGEQQWDAIVSIWCHLPPGLRQDVHSRAMRALKPGGVLILESYRPKQLEYKTGGPPVAEMMMTEDTLRKELCLLDFVHLVETDREIHEGPGHNGLSAVVQCIAKRG
ncbi:MAG: class I SAM-dependent methyltransferase [Ignavibacteriae bacterium]|nr:MAG: class I SAM-dependent methyltransferase [Ignavibacteriota bacterium]